VKMAGLDATVFTPPPRERPKPFAARLIIPAVAAGLLLISLQVEQNKMLVVVGGLGALLVVFYGLPFVTRNRDWLICALLMVLLITGVSFLDPTTRSLFHYSALALLCFPVLGIALRSDVFRSGGFRLYTVYFLWAACTIPYSLAPEFSLARLAEAFLTLAALAAIVVDIREADGPRRLLSHILVAAGIILFLNVLAALILPHSITWLSPLESYSADELQKMQKLGISPAGLDRFRGLLSGPNDLGGLMLIVVGPALVCWQSASKRQRALLAALVAGAVSLAALADSRSPFVALAIGGAWYSVWRWRARGILVLAAATTMLGAALLVYSHGDLGAYMGRDVGTLTGRTDIWSFVIQQIKDRPILGYGYEVSGAIFQSVYFPVWWGPWDLGPHSSLHNGYLDHAVGVGIPATLFWLYIILEPWVFVFRRSGDSWNLKPIFFLIVVPILINNFSEALLGDFTDSVGIVFGLVWALGERYRLLALQRADTVRAETLASLPGSLAALAEAGEVR
jgi:O-antigen ligase